MMGVILELLIKFVVFRPEGSNKNITNKTINPLTNPKSMPKNLSKPEAPDHFINLLINLIIIPPKNIKIIKTSIIFVFLTKLKKKG